MQSRNTEAVRDAVLGRNET